MAWELKKVEDQRKILVNDYLKGLYTIKELCTRFGVSRKTAHKWLKRYQLIGEEGLKDQSKARHTPSNIYSNELIEIALNLKYKYPSWGPRKILAKLEAEYPRIEWPSTTRLYEIFKKENLICPRRLRSRVPATQPLGNLNNSNDIWIADFKGWFLTGDKKKCEPLTITDAFSRYLIKCEHLERKTVNNVWTIFKEAFEEYGLPDRVRTDNGPPFGSTGAGRLTRLSVNLIKAGVIPEWINPGHPEENGRHERFHLTLKKAVANPPAKTLEEQIQRMNEYKFEYNFERPHESLQMTTPANTYNNSKRKWDGLLRAPEYDSGMEVRKVTSSGCIWLKQIHYYIGDALSGEFVALKDGIESIEVYYGPIYLGKLNESKNVLDKPPLIPKNKVRRG